MVNASGSGPAQDPAAGSSSPSSSAPPPASTPPPPPTANGLGVAGIGPAPGLAYADFGVRAIALVIDFIVIGLIQGVIAAVFGLGFIGFYGTDVFRPGFTFEIGPFRLIWAVLAAAVSGVYFVYTWRTGNASPGQRFMSLEVRNAADGGALTQDQAIRRWAFLTAPIISALPGLGPLVFLYQLYLAYTTWTDPNRQGFHDKQAGSVVVRRVA